MSSTLLQVDGLTLVTSHGSIVDDLSFQISAGEIVALTGKSGSGKTSIGLALLDLLPSGIKVQNGTIRWFGKNNQTLILPGDNAAWIGLRGRHIGYTPQDVFSTFDPVMTMEKQMSMIVNERTGEPEIEIRNELRLSLEEVGLQDIDRLLDSYPHQLSGGQLQRCQIAMAILMKPSLLISDEPTSAIDKINQVELLEVFSSLRLKYDMAILCITHEEAVVRSLADREVRLDHVHQDFLIAQPYIKLIKSNERPLMLEAKGLVYEHVYGGMASKNGAVIGKLDFELRQGTCLGIVGESGSGKSTLAQLLVGLYAPSEGEVIVEGKKIDFQKSTDIQFLRSKIQLVMQDGRGSLHPYINIRDILTDVWHFRYGNKDAADVPLRKALQEVDLPESVLDRKASQLSGGECLRVSLARAMLMHPEILICDESTSSLDAQTRDSILQLLLRLQQERSLALIFISHDEWIIRGVAQNILVLADGKVVEQGSAEEVIKYPTHPVSKKIFTFHATSEEKDPL